MNEFSTRRSFGKRVDKVVTSNFIGVQRVSYENFLQMHNEKQREDQGLQKLFNEVFCIKDLNLKNHIEFLGYTILAPEFTEDECVKKNRTYNASLKVKFRLTRYDGKSEKNIVKEIKEQEIYFGQVPLMSENGSFIVNGVFRTIVSQLHKSPGIFFEVESIATQVYKKNHFARIVPNRGMWLDIEIDSKDVCWVKFDKRKKILLSTFLLLIDNEKHVTHNEILNTYYSVINYKKSTYGWTMDYDEKLFKNTRLSYDLINAETGEVVVPFGKIITARKLKELSDLQVICVKSETLMNGYLAQDIHYQDTIYPTGTQIDEKLYNILVENKQNIKLLNIDHERVSSCLRDTIFMDKIKNYNEALVYFYKVMKPNETYSAEVASNLFQSLFYDDNRFDLSDVGRVRLNSRLKQYYPEGYESFDLSLNKEDIIAIVKGLLNLKNTNGSSDNIDNLASRRVRSVGELVMNQCRGSFYKISKALKERLANLEADEKVEFYELFNTKILSSSLREFFGTSQLSQMMDNLNPLAKLAHDRRITVMGKGGVVATRASDGMRDVGESYYGRICPVETPEGINIGLISYLSVYANIDNYGFLQTPYLKVVNGKITNEIEYLNAQIEELYNIASYSAKVNENNEIIQEEVICRRACDYVKVTPQEVQYIDVSCRQILSVAASLIPFINHIDPGRALMGSNMQRQALPLKIAEAPLVGTGIEKQIGVDSMNCVVAKATGKVIKVDSTCIVVQDLENKLILTTYELKKFQRSNAYSCVNQNPIISLGDIVEKDQVIADGTSTDKGEIALGKNLRIAFMSFKGYTFEDSIVLSDRLINDKMTSVRIEELNIAIKKGDDITRSIPNISENSLRNLDETGIVSIGAKVKTGDVLIGRVVMKVETTVSPEEKLLKAMFGEKANNVADASLKVPPGITGTVIDVQILSKQGGDKDERALLNEKIELQRLEKNRNIELKNIFKYYNDILIENLITYSKNETILLKGSKMTMADIARVDCDDIGGITIKDKALQKNLDTLNKEYLNAKKQLNDKFANLSKKIIAGDDLPNGVIKQIKVFIAINRVIEAGDKLAGRYGNKGVVARVIPVADMPYDANGNPIDVVLNPLGIAARMNIGQIFEMHLGWISKEIGSQVSTLLGKIYKQEEQVEKLRELLTKVYPRDKVIQSYDLGKLIEIACEISNGLNFAVPSFDGPSIQEIKNLLKDWGLPETGKLMLRDGETGEFYDQPIAIGYMYIMKLNHMVADKIHARSTGNYSLITQQPPGGRAKMGGQRKGEMEIWALQAYGAAYLVKEAMTIKSDDHAGRIAAYESIIRGEEVVSENNLPEGFKVLMQELRAILLNAECLNRKTDEEGKTVLSATARGSDFDVFKISLMSPEMVRKLSFGEVKKAETINYRTRKAEIGGLHCPAIFGPEKNYQCHCQRYNRVKFRGIVCEKCGVEVTVSRVRRERMGHIELATPVAHIWFTKILPSSIGTILDMTSKILNKILRFEIYIVVKPGVTPMSIGDTLTPNEFEQAKLKFGADSFTALIGAAGIEALLKNINLEEEREFLLLKLKTETNEIVRKKIIKRYKIIQGFINNNARPEWMIIRTLPVLPADLRPLVALDGGRFATPDINDLYRRVINRNIRLKALNELGFPDIVKQNEERMISIAVNAIIDNSRLDQPFTASNGRMLQSIGDVLKGKQGRFRQNLLGKRVDYSGRSVIVVGPNLKLHQCGLPRTMALELFKPFVYARLEQYGYAATVKSAKIIVDELRPEVWEILKEIVYQHPVLLNRPPTLHRLGIQAFECILVETNAIQLHPLVCFAFNADFDGDQMSVHVPLTVEAQAEARVLMMATNNMISPANGKSVVSPKKDMVLGLYYLTMSITGAKGEGMAISSNTVNQLVFDEHIDIHALIDARIDCAVEGNIHVTTTAGRVILYNALPKNHNIAFSDVNKLFLASDSGRLFEQVYANCKRNDAVIFADTLMTLGFKYATKSGISFSAYDIVDLKIKDKTVKDTQKMVNEYNRQYMDGLITETERKHQVMEAWTKCDTFLGKALEGELSKENEFGLRNPLYMMYHSGARGTTSQMRQVMSMRGLVAKTSGEMMENVIIPNYKEGFDAHNYFDTTHGTRKGFSDMALKTADAGYFTRKLVDTAQDCIINNTDCLDTYQNTYNQDAFLTYEPEITMKGVNYSEIAGRVLALDVYDENQKLLVSKDIVLTEEHVKILEDNYVFNVKLRSPVTCLNEFGICAKCYGVDLSKGKLASIGEPVGIIAAQSIGEPAAQLTLRTFHTGGGARRESQHSSMEAISDGKIKLINAKIVKKDKYYIVISRQAECQLLDEANRMRMQFRIPYASKIFFKQDDKVKKGESIAEWDNSLILKLSNIKAYVRYVDLIENVSLRTVVDEVTGQKSRIISAWKNARKKNLEPSLMFEDENGKLILTEDNKPMIYKLESDDIIMVEDKSLVEIGDVLIKKYKVIVKSSDITSGLASLVELFEARNSKIQAVITEITGVVTIGKDYRMKRSIIVTPQNGEPAREYIVVKTVNLLVQSGDIVKKGDPLCEGDIALHDILYILGVEKLVLHLLQSIQGIFKKQSMTVDNKHIECIIRYMLKKIQIIDGKNTKFIKDQEVDYLDFVEEMKTETEQPEFKRILQGISKAASMDRSLLKSASFQEPHKVLVKALLSDNGQNVDQMRGMKEAIMSGKLIPAGTGILLKQKNNQ